MMAPARGQSIVPAFFRIGLAIGASDQATAFGAGTA
jgi:hypothetical protein